MASLRIFCHPSELKVWLQELCVVQNLSLFAFDRRETYGNLISDLDGFEIEEPIWRMFFMPTSQQPESHLTLTEARPRPMGWLDVQPGHLGAFDDRQCLFLTTVTGEDFETEPNNLSRHVHRLKRQIRGAAKCGVVARNTVYGGENSYRDIWFTADACSLHREGALWKQRGAANIDYFPPTENSRT